MNYNQTIEFLFSQLPAYHRIGKAAYKNDLNNTIAFDNYLGSPHGKYMTIHVGGTNGKGSVSHMIASILMDAGYKTGLYTSPHLTDFRERIRVDGKMISRSFVTRFISNHSDFIGILKPSFFEMTVALAFDYFASAEVDIAVIEVGLGGRLDSTNIINPVLSVITNIGHDHMDLLGDSLEKIAREKAGIIKKGIPVVISETSDEVKDVFIRKAEDENSDIFFADDDFDCSLGEYSTRYGKRKFRITDKKRNIHLSGEIPLAGDYQAANIRGVFQACNVLKGNLNLTDANILRGIRNVVKNTFLRGRWQKLSDKPLIICDTGHNLEGLRYNLSQISRIPRSKLLIVLGFVNDKDTDSVLPLFPSDAKYYFAKASVPRAMNANVLRNKALQKGLTGLDFSDVESALRAALNEASGDDVIFIGGSTFVVADALRFL
ncbi:MAG: bifunctional folylpolyglutamate synthase/dihydrofolate synthase [Bacteroidales bacterium]|nr:bifunctional folylpolyglutamate synthase/dihydrofolate synthase [Bacteroidales bacterium]